MSQKTIASIENGKKGTTIDTLVAIAEVLNASLDYIVIGKEDNQVLNNMLMNVSKEKQEMALKILKGILENI